MNNLILLINGLLLLLFTINLFAQSTNSATSNSIPTQGLVAYWPLAGNAVDSSGNGNNGTISGATAVQNRFGVNNGAYSFNGTSNAIDFGNILDSVFCAPVAKFSVSGWALVRANQSYYSFIIGKMGGGNSGEYQWDIAYLNGSVFGHVTSDTLDQNRIIVEGPAAINQWFHFVLVFDGSQPKLQRVQLYVNGSSESTSISENVGNLGTTTVPCLATLDIGATLVSNIGYWSDFLNGDVDEIRIYDRALSSAEIEQLYSEGGWPLNIHTASATNITSTTATINGTVNPNGLSTSVQFDYGTTTSYGTTVAASQSPVTGSTAVSVSANLTGLTQNTLYHFRLEATNSAGTTYGADSTFTTLSSTLLWQQASPSYATVQAFAIGPNGTGGTNLYAGVVYGVLRSTNNGLSWTQVNNGLADTAIVVSLAVSPNNVTGADVFAGTANNGVYLSTNNGSSWTQVNNGLTNKNVRSLLAAGTSLFALTYETTGSVFLSTNNGSSWTLVNNGLTNYDVNSFTECPDTTGTLNFYAAAWEGAFRSTNNGSSWTPAGLSNLGVISIAASSNEEGGINLFAGTNGNGVYFSSDNGSSWTQVNNGITDLFIFALAVSPNGAGGSNLFAGTSSGVFLSTNNGSNWTLVNNGLTNTFVITLVVSGTTLIAGNNGGIFYASLANLTAIKEITNSATKITSTTATLNGIVNPNGLSTVVQFDYGTNTGYGTTVTASQSPVTGSSNVSVSANLTGLASNTLYHFRVKATNGNGITYGPDSTFSTIKRGDIDGNISNGPDAYSASLVLKYLAGLDTLNAQQLADAEVDGNTGLTANDAYWILYATAYGSFPDGSVPKAEGPSTGTISAGQLCSQENSNLVTIPIILQKSHGIHACYIELNINKSFADIENVAANIPRDWLMVHNYVNGVLKIAMAGVTPLTDGNLAAISLNLKDKNAGFSINGSAKLNANLNQAINNFTVQAVPNQFGLSQNYPNPFNPSTTIKYQLARDSHVSLTVYDILGQKVRTLINELQQAGYYNITWDGNNDAGNKAASGVYIYRLQSGNFIKTLKMNLLK